MDIRHLNALRALEATLRLGNFSAAAGELNVTPAAVGQQVRGLEEALGRPLFERDNGRLTPLPAAEAEAERLGEAFRLLARSLAGLKHAPEPDAIGLTMTHSIAELWLSPALPEFYGRTEGLKLRLETSFDLVDLDASGLDFAIRHIDRPAPGLTSVPLFPELVAPICTPDFAARYDLGPDTRDLTGVPRIVNPVHTTDTSWQGWESWSATTGVHCDPAGPVMNFGYFSSVPRLALAGLGLGLGGVVLVSEELRKGQLCLPFGAEALYPTAFSYCLVWPAHRRLTPLQREFRDWVKELAERLWSSLTEVLGATVTERLRQQEVFLTETGA